MEFLFLVCRLVESGAIYHQQFLGKVIILIKRPNLLNYERSFSRNMSSDDEKCDFFELYYDIR